MPVSVANITLFFKGTKSQRTEIMILSTSLPSLHKTSIFLFAITLSFYVTKVHATTITNNYRSTIFISNGLLPAGNDEIILNSAESITIPEAWGNPRHRYVHIRDSAGKQLSGAMANKYGTLKLAALENYVIVNTPDAQVYLANEDIPEGGDIEEPESNPEGNLLKNSNFTDKLTHWNCAGTVAITDEKSLILTPDMVTTSRVSQIVTGLETGVEYQLSANIDSTNVWAYIGVRKVTERGAASSGILKMKFIAPANRIKVYLQTWKKQNGNAVFTSVVLKKVASGDDNNGSGEEGEVPQLVYGEVRNSGFENGTDEWQVVSGNENVIIAEVDAYQEKSYLRMISSESTVKIKQDIAVKPETMYTCAVRMRLCRKNITVPLNALAGMFEIKGDTQRNIVNNSRFNKLVVERLDWAGEEQEDVWLEKRTIFYTAVDAKNVTLYLTVDKGSAGTVDFDSIRLIEGNMDIPEEYANIQRMRPDLPEVKMSGENMIANNTFFDGTKKWLTSGTVIAQNGSIKLISGELSARSSILKRF